MILSSKQTNRGGPAMFQALLETRTGSYASVTSRRSLQRGGRSAWPRAAVGCRGPGPPAEGGSAPGTRDGPAAGPGADAAPSGCGGSRRGAVGPSGARTGVHMGFWPLEAPARACLRKTRLRRKPRVPCRRTEGPETVALELCIRPWSGAPPTSSLPRSNLPSCLLSVGRASHPSSRGLASRRLDSRIYSVVCHPALTAITIRDSH